MFDISFSFVCRVLNYTNSRGIDSETLLKNAGVDLSHFSRLDNKIAASCYFAILEEAIRLTNDPCFGLHMGEFFEWRDFSNLGYILAGCRDLREAMEKASDYLNFIGSPFDLKMINNGRFTEIVFAPKNLQQIRLKHATDEMLSSFIKIIRIITSKSIHPKEVRISYPAPDDWEEYRRIFSCPVVFDQPTTALVLYSPDLLEPVVCGHGNLFPIPEALTTKPRENINGIKAYSKKTSLLLFKQLQKGSPCITEVAKELGMSVRCLQLKLRKEGQTFSQIVRKVRKELAETYLVEKDYSIDEITYLLGFSDPSVFHRAFKSWTGTTPGKFRNAS